MTQDELQKIAGEVADAMTAGGFAHTTLTGLAPEPFAPEVFATAPSGQSVRVVVYEMTEDTAPEYARSASPHTDKEERAALLDGARALRDRAATIDAEWGADEAARKYEMVANADVLTEMADTYEPVTP